MSLMLGIITGALLLACVLVAVWMVGAIYYDVCGGAKLGRWAALAWDHWRDRDVRCLTAALAADRCLARGGVAIPGLVVPTETEQRPRLGP